MKFKISDSRRQFLSAVASAAGAAIVLRSQGMLSFREFSPYLHGKAGVPFAKLIVALDNVLSERSGTKWSGDALFAVLERRRT